MPSYWKGILVLFPLTSNGFAAYLSCALCWVATLGFRYMDDKLWVLTTSLRATRRATSQLQVTCGDAKIITLPISGQWPLAGQGGTSLQAGGGWDGAARAPLQVMGWWPLTHPASSGPSIHLTLRANSTKK